MLCHLHILCCENTITTFTNIYYKSVLYHTRTIYEFFSTAPASFTKFFQNPLLYRRCNLRCFRPQALPRILRPFYEIFTKFLRSFYEVFEKSGLKSDEPNRSIAPPIAPQGIGQESGKNPMGRKSTSA